METARAAGIPLRGFTDPQPSSDPLYLGRDEVLADFQDESVILGVGCVKADRIRQKIVTSLGLPEERWAILVSPNAIVASDAKIGHGVVILAGALVNSGAVIGPHAIINSFAMIDHDASVGAYTHVAPGAILGGGASIGERSMVGINACIRDHVSVGPDTTIGMGAVVTRKSPGGVTLVGCPAKAA